MKHKILSLGHKILRVWWHIFKPITLGVRAIVVDEKGWVLLVKHTYEDYWYIPGGGVKKGETFEQAIRRELLEETGYEINIIELFGVYNNTYEGKLDNIVVFVCRNGNFIEFPRSLEIEKYEFFNVDVDNIDNLPENTSRGTRKRIKEFCDSNRSNSINTANISNHFGIW